VRALVVGDDAAVLRRLAGFFSGWGVTHQTTNVAAEALAKLRSAASMGDNWAIDLVVVYLGTMRGNPQALMKNITREPTLERVRCLFLGGDELPAELRSEQRASSVQAAFGEADLRIAVNRLLDVQEAGARSQAPEPEPEEPDLSIAPAPSSTSVLSGHVLLVEDNPVNRQVAQRILGLLGLSLDTAENGKEALEKLEAGRFDLVLMDCQMPVMDGYTATRVRRGREAEGRMPRIAIVAMTANAMAGDREKCLAAGMDEYLSKPLNRGLLEQTLRRWLPKGARSQASVAPAVAPSQTARPAPSLALAENSPASPLAPRDGAALDQEIVRDLLDVMGEEFTDLVGVYLEDTPKNLSLLEAAAARGDVNGLIAPSHSLKSTSANLGAMTLAEIAKRIEHGARGSTLGDPTSLVRDLAREYGRVSAELRNLLARSGA
jgi:CheY-like chemotaxis protein/HPt (histidine-containing phosphotransfer) domain-containing protein